MPSSSFGDYRQYQWEVLQNSRPFHIPWTHLRHWSYSEDLIHQQSMTVTKGIPRPNTIVPVIAFICSMPFAVLSFLIGLWVIRFSKSKRKSDSSTFCFLWPHFVADTTWKCLMMQWVYSWYLVVWVEPQSIGCIKCVFAMCANDLIPFCVCVCM